VHTVLAENASLKRVRNCPGLKGFALLSKKTVAFRGVPPLLVFKRRPVQPLLKIKGKDLGYKNELLLPRKDISSGLAWSKGEGQ